MSLVRICAFCEKRPAKIIFFNVGVAEDTEITSWYKTIDMCESCFADKCDPNNPPDKLSAEEGKKLYDKIKKEGL